MNQFSVWIFLSVMCILLMRVESGGGKKEKIHFKIHVPKIIDKEYHTKTIYVHVHDEEPPKEHHHEHDHKHFHHGGGHHHHHHGGGKEHKGHHGGGEHEKHHGHHGHHGGHKHGKDDGLDGYHYYHSYHDDYGYHDSYDHYDHDRSSPDTVSYTPYGYYSASSHPNAGYKSNYKTSYNSHPQQAKQPQNYYSNSYQPKNQNYYSSPKQPEINRYNNYPQKRNNLNHPNHIKDSSPQKPATYEHKPYSVKHNSDQYSHSPKPVHEKIIPVHEMPEKGEHVTEIRNQNYEFVGYKNDDPPYFHMEVEPPEYDSYERVTNMDDPSKSTYSYGHPYGSHYNDKTNANDDANKEDEENQKVPTIEDEFNIPYEKERQRPRYQNVQQHTPSVQNSPHDVAYNSYGYPIGADSPFKITQNSYNHYSYPPISGNTLVRDSTGQSIPAEELLKQEYNRYMEADKSIREDYSVPVDSSSDESDNYDFDSYMKNMSGDESRNQGTVLYTVNGDPIKHSESNIKTLRVHGSPNFYTNARNRLRPRY